MKLVIVFCLLWVQNGSGNRTIINIDEAGMQLYNFRERHPRPIGIQTVDSGSPVDIRDNYPYNADLLFKNNFINSLLKITRERIPERIVHAKAAGAWGYFEVTNDVSKYTKADVFNVIGKKTPVLLRFSTATQNMGGNDLNREAKGVAIKFFTAEGILDFLCFAIPIFFFRAPDNFIQEVHSFRRNPSSNLFDFNTVWEFITKHPDMLHAYLWLLSDYGVPDSYRRMDAFPLHTYELINKKGDAYYARFNFRTEQGLGNFTTAQTRALADNDYYKRDLYNYIENKTYPSWRLEMDVMSFNKIKNVDYDPFNIIRLWKPNTYTTVPIGRLVVNRNPVNFFSEIEMSAFDPNNLVPGIPGPNDLLFRARRLAYQDAQNYRLGRNIKNIYANSPYYAKTYHRDGRAPVDDNMKDTPNYFPNSFNGPIPYVDDTLPREKLVILETNAIDLQFAHDFYNTFVKDERHRDRLTDNVITAFENVLPELQERTIRLMYLTDKDLGHRVRAKTYIARAAGTIPSYKNKEEIRYTKQLSEEHSWEI